MLSQNKYLKYKNKYLELKNQLGGDTALVELMNAIRIGDENMVHQLILEKKVDVNQILPQTEGLTPLMMAITYDGLRNKNYMEIVKILLNNNADVNIVSVGRKRTALNYAVDINSVDNEQTERQKEYIELLLRKGANHNHVDLHNLSILDHALLNDNSKYYHKDNPILHHFLSLIKLKFTSKSEYFFKI